jgi:hypothetical protein
MQFNKPYIENLVSAGPACNRLCMSPKFSKNIMKTHTKSKYHNHKPPSAPLVRRVYKQLKSERAVAHALIKQGFKTSRSSINGYWEARMQRFNLHVLEVRETVKRSVTAPIVG